MFLTDENMKEKNELDSTCGRFYEEFILRFCAVFRID